MGKKRTRVPGEPRSSAKNVNVENPVAHPQTLEDDVREQRDSQFALEKKRAERTKRRKMGPLSATRSDAKLDSQKSSRMDARTAGLDVWREAARRRKMKSGGTSDGAGTGAEDKDEEAIKNDEEIEVKLDRKTNAKIVQEARQQRAEIRAENGGENGADHGATNTESQNAAVNAALRTLAVKNDSDDSDEDDDDGDSSNDADSDKSGPTTGQLRELGLVDDDGRSVAADTEFEMRSTFGDDDRDLDFLDGSKVTEADELALSLFNPPAGEESEQAGGVKSGQGDGLADGPKVMLADIILQKIQEKEVANARAAAIAADPERAAREAKIAEVYGLVGNIMSRYRSGKVPKAFKVIPKVENWEELLYLTRPDEWSPAAVYVATRILSSNLNAKELLPYYRDILLPRCLEDISSTKKLNYHLFRALVKAIYKPGAFCKGILFPLCADGDGGCTLRQASVFASVVSKVSIPMLHSAAALLYMCQLRFSVTTCLLITALIEKKYALPYRVIDAAVIWFMKMREDSQPLPVLWHKCLLAFAQRYKMELTKEQKEKLKVLMRVHTHRLVTPEIRRELFSSRNRGDMIDPDANTIARNIEIAAMED